MSRDDLKAIVDRCSRSERRYLLAYLRTKDPEYRRKLAAAEVEAAGGNMVRLRSGRRGLIRVRRSRPSAS